MRRYRWSARHRAYDLWCFLRVVGRLPRRWLVQEDLMSFGPDSGATQVAILDLRKEDAEKAGKEMVTKFGERPFTRK